MAIKFRNLNDTYYVSDEENPYDAAQSKDSGLLFTFGAVGSVRVLYYGSSFEDGLEATAGWLKDNGFKGLYMAHDGEEMQEAYDDALTDLYPGQDFDDLSDIEQNQVRQQAETDLIYTEAGFLSEWGVTDLDYGDQLYGKGVAAYVMREPDIAADEDYDEVEDLLLDAGAPESYVKRALDAVEQDDLENMTEAERVAFFRYREAYGRTGDRGSKRGPREGY